MASCSGEKMKRVSSNSCKQPNQEYQEDEAEVEAKTEAEKTWPVWETRHYQLNRRETFARPALVDLLTLLALLWLSTV